MIFMLSSFPFNFGPFILFPIFFIIIAIVFIFFVLKGSSNVSGYMRTEMDNIAQDKAQFYSSNNLSNNSSNNFTFKKIYCNQCGSIIQKNDLFCSNCGDTTKDELNMLS